MKVVWQYPNPVTHTKVLTLGCVTQGGTRQSEAAARTVTHTDRMQLLTRKHLSRLAAQRAKAAEPVLQHRARSQARRQASLLSPITLLDPSVSPATTGDDDDDKALVEAAAQARQAFSFVKPVSTQAIKAEAAADKVSGTGTATGPACCLFGFQELSGLVLLMYNSGTVASGCPCFVVTVTVPLYLCRCRRCRCRGLVWCCSRW